MGDGAASMEVEDEENVQGDPTDELSFRVQRKADEFVVQGAKKGTGWGWTS